MSSDDQIRIRVPRQDLENSSFFTCKETAVIEWVAQLPKANIGQTTRQLFQAISELNRVRLLPEERFKILEQLRAQIHFVSRSLSKHYLNQPIILPKQAKQVANLSHTLHQQMVIGYTIVASHASALGKRIVGGKPEQLIAKSLYRAITESTLNLVRHYQLYESADKQLWQQLHQFYLLAKQHNALNTPVSDKEVNDGSVLNGYTRALLLGAAKPKQLRQEDFKHLLAPLTGWGELCQIEHASQESLFVINPLSDAPPLYREAYESAIDSNWLSLDTRRLTQHIENLRQQQSGLMITDGAFIISNDLLGHLLLAWSEMSKRTFMRLESNDELNISVGLSSTHHFSSGEMSFEALLSDSNSGSIVMEKTNRFMRPPTIEARHKDVWDSPYESNVGQTNVAMESIDFHINKSLQDDKETSKYKDHQVSALNSSPKGYCIEWPDDNPISIKAGEIVGIQEPHGHNWSVGVIRWIDHQHDKSTQLGLELISPTASPYGARIVQKTGPQNEFLRVLVLPEMASLNIPVTLITPRVPFKEGQKVTLNQQGKEVQIQLTKKLNETGAYNRFEFRKISSAASNSKKAAPGTAHDGDLDSLWNNL